MAYVLAGYGSIWLVWIPLRLFTKSKGRRGLSTACKVIPTLMAAGLAGRACMAHANAGAAPWLVFAGLLLGAAADAALEIRFTVGGTLFFLAHGLYTAAFFTLCPPNVWTLPVFLTALLLAALFLKRYGARVTGRMLRAGAAVYAVALCALLASALPAPFLAESRQAAPGALGAALFVLSDALLCRNAAARRKAGAPETRADGKALRRRRALEAALSLGCYYTAQTALAVSVVAGLSA